jgi:hypothetical protein
MLEGYQDPTKPQPGAVTFTDWRGVPWNSRSIRGITGKVQIVSSQEALGFEIHGGNHANWIAIVAGDDEVYAVPGCQVAGVSYGTRFDNPDFTPVP